VHVVQKGTLQIQPNYLDNIMQSQVKNINYKIGLICMGLLRSTKIFTKDKWILKSFNIFKTT